MKAAYFAKATQARAGHPPPVETMSANPFHERCQQVAREEAVLWEGGGPDGLARQHKLGRLFARERIAALIDQPDSFLECGLWAAHGMYADWGRFPAAGVVTGIAQIAGHPCMIVANDATVKAGAFVPMTCKKVLRPQHHALALVQPVVARGQENKRNVAQPGLLPERLKHAKAVQAGHFDVAEDDLGPDLGRQFQPGQAIFGGVYGVTR